MTVRGRAVLIAGPTASGKSALALRMAQDLGGTIINADAMQVYDTLQVVTARPGAADMQAADHLLYGTVPAATRFSTGQWLTAVGHVLSSHDGSGPVIFAGGTGLYFDALLNGFADVPEVSPEIALEVQQEIQALDGAERLALLQQEDPVAASRLKVADPQRLTRALAVKRATGRTLSSFQDEMSASLLADYSVERLVLNPDRQVLRQRIAERFQTMFSGGAVEEVQALRHLDLDPSLPVMKAIGVREIGDWLDGIIGRDEAIAIATIATQQYAKRQRTWFRNRFGDWPRRGLGGA
ncbi:MAG TPA: tRNA (adenosine(37)-N6)-dimethylallyltransferase MiaA [Devosia sp.]|uniref:tRNA (adenosine(37)-N6)-dimethylallyltransferase MiaA n=1 Tax=Devosia sp. TaxID=1871048 RepID=UPI002F931F5E